MMVFELGGALAKLGIDERHSFLKSNLIFA
jgi:hypothetical protein